MDIDALRLGLEVARRGSFAAVARDHGTDASTVSRIVAALEREVGARLFQRSTRRLSLTEAGALYLDQIAPLLQALDGARDAARATSGGPTGTLRMTASAAFGTKRLVPLLPAFRAALPGVTLELLLTDENLDLVAERIDLAIRLAPIVESDVVGAKLMDTRYFVCAAPEYVARAGVPATPRALAGHRCLLFSLPEFRARWLFRDAAGAVETVPVAGDVVLSSAYALYEATRLGHGPALLPDWLIAEDLASGALIDLFPGHRATATDFSTAAWLLYPSRAFLPAKVRAAIDFLRGAFGR